MASLAGRHELFHYTTVEGLHGIVQDNCIWATAASYLNDASEVEYGCALLGEVFEEWQAENSDRQTRAHETVKYLKRDFNDPLSRLKRAATIYAACFCQEDNLLSQWRAYGQAGGYSIGFALFGSGLETLRHKLVGLKAESEAYSTKLVPVIYDRQTQVERLRAVLRKALPVLDAADIREEVSKEGDKADAEAFALASTVIEDLLLDQIVAFKNDAFKEENEYRIVARQQFGLLRRGSQRNSSGLYLRCARGLMVPYIKIVPIEGKLPIKSIRYGPSLQKTRAENSLNLLLSLNGYKGVAIRGSQIPIVL